MCNRLNVFSLSCEVCAITCNVYFMSCDVCVIGCDVYSIFCYVIITVGIDIGPTSWLLYWHVQLTRCFNAENRMQRWTTMNQRSFEFSNIFTT